MPRHERVAILVDHKNLRLTLNNGYKVFDTQTRSMKEVTPHEKFESYLGINVYPREKKLINLPFWSSLQKQILQQYVKNSFTASSIADITHMGTWLFISQRAHPYLEEPYDDEEIAFLDLMSEVDSLFGYIAKYSIDNTSRANKGVDVNLVCQMLLGAFQDEYDTCILVSDDLSFVPSVDIAQNYRNKRIFHAGFTIGPLRAACYGSIPFENGGFQKIFPISPT